MRSKILIVLIFVLSITVASTGCDGQSNELPELSGSFRLLIPAKNELPNSKVLNQLLRDAANDFAKKHPDLVLQIEEIPWNQAVDDYFNKLKGLECPDVLLVGSTAIKDLFKRDAILDMNVLVKLHNYDTGIYYEPVLRAMESDGKLAALPLVASTFGILYNKELFDKGNIPLPTEDWTWEQFSEIANQLEDPSTLLYNPIMVDLLLASLDGSLISPDGKTTRSYLDSDKSVQAFQWLNHYYRDIMDASYPIPNYSYSSGNGFLKGVDAMQPGTFDLYTFYKEFVDIGVLPLPRFENGIRANPTFADGFAIPKEAENPAVALQFIEFFMDMKQPYLKQLSQMFLIPIKDDTNIFGKETDLAMRTFLNELRYSVSPSLSVNVQFNELVSLPNSPFASRIGDLLEASDNELPMKLKILSNDIDKKLAEKNPD